MANSRETPRADRARRNSLDGAVFVETDSAAPGPRTMMDPLDLRGIGIIA